MADDTPPADSPHANRERDGRSEDTDAAISDVDTEIGEREVETGDTDTDTTQPNTDPAQADTGDAAGRSVDDGVQALGEPDVRRAVFGHVTTFAAAGIGLGVIIFLSLIRLIGLDFTEPAEIISSIFLLSEVYLLFGAVVAAGITTYILLAGLIGVDSGSRFDTDIQAMTAAGAGSAIGVCAMFVILLLATAGGFAVLNAVAPPLDELTAVAGGAPGAGELATGESVDGGPDEGSGLTALELIGVLLSVVVSGLVLAAIAGITGVLTAYITRRYEPA